ncbi:MAG: RidA family protein [Lachnospiraceae bacterium]|nr:RidA family protein [Lachnospiraceae bacterium]
MELKRINAPMAPAAVGPYVHAVKAGDTLYTSGQIGIVPATGELASGIIAQTHQAINNLRSVLLAAGLDFENVVRTMVFLADINDFATFNEIYAFYFKDALPARSCVQAAALPKGALIEIEAIAVG